METLVVLISVDYFDSRKLCELMENQEFDTINDVFKYLNEKMSVKCQAFVYRMTDFMEAVNDQELDNLSEFFMSYVKVKNAKKP